ncbi:hypothetical protein [Streptosporangium longisporum]|uniref:hypothetical protein n=1 Tax=Streptosporangium longisporum TaxID=46187 RepID=UPI0031EDEC2F
MRVPCGNGAIAYVCHECGRPQSIRRAVVSPAIETRPPQHSAFAGHAAPAPATLAAGQPWVDRGDPEPLGGAGARGRVLGAPGASGVLGGLVVLGGAVLHRRDVRRGGGRSRGSP